jgi:hypothetical protein
MKPVSLLTALVLVAAPRQSVGQGSAPLTADLMREDIAWFRESVFRVEQSYSPAARAEAERRLTKLEGAMNSLTPVAFEVEIARIVALADNGHSNVNAGGRARRHNRVPLRFVTFGDEFRVLRAASSHADLLGAKLVAIDGRPIGAVRDSARTLFGGTPAWRDRSVPWFLESPAQMHALVVARDAAAAEYAFETTAGKRVDRRIVGDGPDATLSPPPDLLLYAALPPSGDASWQAIVPPTLPWSLRDPQTFFRWRMAPEVDGLVIQLRRVVDGAGMSILTFLGEMTAMVREKRPRNVVIDMRLNSGGDLNNARDFMTGLPELVPGRIFVLTGPSTFSAAISSVGYLEQAAPTKVTIVGEEVGDRLVFFAEGRPATAPNSRMTIGIATQRHDYMNGCRAFTDCHGPVIRFPIAVPTLRPDLPAPLTFDAWRAGRDPAMEAVEKALKAGH